VNIDQIEAAAGSKVYRKLSKELAEILGIKVPRASTRREEFQILKDILVKSKHDSQKMTRTLAEQIIRVGGHPRFPRYAE